MVIVISPREVVPRQCSQAARTMSRASSAAAEGVGEAESGCGERGREGHAESIHGRPSLEKVEYISGR